MGSEDVNTQLKQLADETREFTAANNEYLKTTAAHSQDIQKELTLFKTRYGASTKNFERASLRRKMEALEKESRQIQLDMARHDVDQAQKGVLFAERRLKIMKEKLAELE